MKLIKSICWKGKRFGIYDGKLSTNYGVVIQTLAINTLG